MLIRSSAVANASESWSSIVSNKGVTVAAGSLANTPPKLQAVNARGGSKPP